MPNSQNEITVEKTLGTAAEQARNGETTPSRPKEGAESRTLLDRNSDTVQVESVLDSHDLPRTAAVIQPIPHPDSIDVLYRPRVLHIDYSGYGVMTHVLSILNYADHTRWQHCVLYATDPAR